MKRTPIASRPVSVSICHCSQRFGAECAPQLVAVGGLLDGVKGLAAAGQAVGNVQAGGFVGVAGLLEEAVEISDVASPGGAVAALLGFEAGAIPVACGEGFARG